MDTTPKPRKYLATCKLSRWNTNFQSTSIRGLVHPMVLGTSVGPRRSLSIWKFRIFIPRVLPFYFGHENFVVFVKVRTSKFPTTRHGVRWHVMCVTENISSLIFLL